MRRLKAATARDEPAYPVTAAPTGMLLSSYTYDPGSAHSNNTVNISNKLQHDCFPGPPRGRLALGRDPK